MDSATWIRTFLDTVRRRLLRRSAATGALHAGLALVAVAMAAPLLASVWQSRSVPLLALVGVAAAVAGGLVGGWLRPARRWADRASAARYVGRREASVASDLRSAVELLEAPETAAPCSPALVDALIGSTAERCRRLRPEALVPSAPLRRPAALLAAAAAAYAGVLLLAPEPLARGWSHLLAGSPEAPFAGASLVDAPLVGDIEIQLVYPAYSGRPDVLLPTSSGDFAALPGTRVTLTTTALAPAARARLLFGEAADDTEADEVLELEVDGDRVRGAFTVTEARHYRFLLESAAGERQVEALPHRIDVEIDRAPTVELHVPADELDVSDLERVEIAYVAEDDYGIARAELVVGDGDDARRLPLPVPRSGEAAAPRAAQHKHVWDLADLELTPGVRIPYRVDVHDTDDVDGPNVGSSRTYHLRVFSPRERHEEVLARQREVIEHMLDVLGARLTVATEDIAAHRAIHRSAREIVVELGTVVAALRGDELTAPRLTEEVDALRGRLDELAAREAELLGRIESGGPQAALGPRLAERLGRSDAANVAELEDGILRFADWLQRQEIENLLALSDEIAAQRERLDKLLEEYDRSGSEEIRKEIERELENLEQRLAALAERQTQVPADVLDRFVNAEALQGDESIDCFAEVRALLDAGDVETARAKMKECSEVLEQGAGALEEALSDLRGERFSEEERKYEQLMSELADLAQDQKDIAGDADAIYERYADEAAAQMADRAEETRAEVGETLEALREQLAKMPQAGLTPFAREERQILDSRLDDVETMLGEGDVADALSMARQAEASLETLQAELAAALEEGWNPRSGDAARAARKAAPLAEELVEKLEAATPSPEQIMSRDDRRALDRLRRRQQAARQRGQKLGQRARELGTELPGESGPAMAEGLERAGQQMGRAEARMRARDPSGARHEAREAADSLSKAQEQARGAARSRQDMGQRGLRDEPVRIPGADEYRPPERFREEILDAMKEDAPAGYDDLVKRYYQELIK